MSAYDDLEDRAMDRIKRVKKKVCPVDDFTVNEILDALQRCKTVADVNHTASHYALPVAHLATSKDPELRVRAVHIKNLAKYQRLAISKGWVKDE